ncbi:hypothetical protein NM688_g5314 [Phlebia brevispora]|uniref:Uncharacterized protein n=1 Tax=Phlebia brevispora TaxID=194682 RepID=A0ACC1SXI9_9APHY|nr:hypothetical protein NM688_g5314 [Phlebia brevispora]
MTTQPSSSEIRRMDIIVDTPRIVQGRPLKMVGRRYTTSTARSASGVTLIFLHGSGNHKEHWEPCIQWLLNEARSFGQGLHTIREAWTFDWQTHGDSAVLNAQAFEAPHSRAGMPDWAAAVVMFIRTRLSSHRLICVGHSCGALTLLYSALFWPEPRRVPYEALVLIEPVAVDTESFATRTTDLKNLDKLFKVVQTRRNEWDSYEAAYAWFVKRAPWSSWDLRTLQLHVRHGLRPLCPGSQKVTTKCDRLHEAESFTEQQTMFHAAEQIERLCDYVPIHLIYGAHNDFPLKDSKRCLTDLTKGRRPASATLIPDAGHTVVQQQPDTIAQALWKIVVNSTPRKQAALSGDRMSRSRL